MAQPEYDRGWAVCEYLSSCTTAASCTCSCQSTCPQGERLATAACARSAFGTYVLVVHLLPGGLGRQNKGVAMAMIRNNTQWELLLMQGVSRFLDRTGNEDRAAIKLHAKAAEYVYEDEYDDSYDDLGGGGADGIADVEGAVLSIPPAAPVLRRPPLWTLQKPPGSCMFQDRKHAVWD